MIQFNPTKIEFIPKDEATKLFLSSIQKSKATQEKPIDPATIKIRWADRVEAKA